MTETTTFYQPRLHDEIDYEAYLTSTGFLRDEEIRFLIENTEIRTYAKGDHLLRPGQVALVCYQNFKGCVREFYLHNGEERTTEFYLEGQSLSNSASSINGSPVKHYWECLEETTLSLFPFELELEMHRRFPRLERLCRIEMEQQVSKLREQLFFFLHSTPEQRYLRLLDHRPELLQRVPQYQLASYLGMQPESLSRIRGRVRSWRAA